MADSNVIGLAMNLDVSDITSGLSQVQKQIQQSQSEFKKATAGMDSWSKSSEGLNAKLSSLTTNLEYQKKGVAGLEAELKRLQSAEGDHSVEIERTQKKLTAYQIKVAQTEKEIKKWSTALDQVQAEEKKSQSALSNLTNTIQEQEKTLKNLNDEYKSAVLQYGKHSKEARTLAKDIKHLSNELEDNNEKMNKAELSSKKLGSGLSGLSKVGDKALKGFAKLGVAVGGLVTGFLATAESTRELRTNMGKVETAFSESNLTAEQAQKTYQKFYGILGDTGKSTEAVSHLAKLAKNQKDLNKWTNIATGIYASFGDSLPIEGLTEAANETAKTGQVTGVLADALNWVGESEDAFNESLKNCTNEQERNALITETLNGLYGEASTKYKENNKDIIAANEAQAQLSQSMADIGAMAEPLMTSLKQLGANAIEAFQPVLEKWIPKIKENLPIIAAGVVVLVGSFLAAKGAIIALNTATATWQVITKSVTAAQWLLNAALTANPIGLIIIAIGALVLAFVALWNKSEGFRNFFIKMWEAIVGAVTAAINGIKTAFNAVVKFFTETIPNAFKKVIDFFKNNWKEILTLLVNPFSGAFKLIYKHSESFRNFINNLTQSIKNLWNNAMAALSNAASNAWAGIKNAFSNIGSFFSGIINAIINAFRELPGKMAEIGLNIVQGLWNGIDNAKDWIIGKISGFTDSILGGIKSFFGIASPSKETAEIGGYLSEGLAQGIEDGASGVVDSAETLGKDTINAMGDGTEESKESFWQKIVTWLKETFGEGILQLLEPVAKALGFKIGDNIADGVEDSNGEIANGVNNALKNASSKVKTETLWDKIKTGLKSALDEMDKKMSAWAQGTGKYFSQVAGYFDDATSKITGLTNAVGGYFQQINEQQQAEIDKQIEALNKANEEQIAGEQARTDAILKSTQEQAEQEIAIKEELKNKQLEELQQQLDEMLISSKTYEAKKKELETELSDFTKQKNQETADIQKQLQQQVADFTEQRNAEKAASEEELTRKKDELGRKQFEANKKTQIAEVWVNLASAIMKTFATSGWLLGGIFAGLLTAAAGVQTATIAKQQYVPALAKGGIADGATLAMIGEAGKEAVLPLERNTGWIDTLAEKLNAVMSKDLLGGISGQNGYNKYSNVSNNNTNNFTQIINAPATPSRRELYRDGRNLLALKGV